MHQHLLHTGYLNHFHSFGSRYPLGSFGNEDPRETELGCFCDALLGARYRAYFTG